MGKRISIAVALLWYCLGSTVAAYVADDGVSAARAVMFEGTRGSLAEACELFEAAACDDQCPQLKDDREPTFLHALARTVRLLNNYRDVSSSERCDALAAEMGLTFAGNALEDFRAILPLGQYNDGGAIGAELDDLGPTLRDFVLPELADIVAGLDSISDSPVPFVMYLTPRETGLMGELEIDYAEVLLLKGLLLAHKALLEVQVARGADTEIESLWREILPTVDVLGVEPGSFEPHDAVGETAIPTEAAQDAADAITCYLDATDHILVEDTPFGTDPQEDELFYLDADVWARVAKMQASLRALRVSLRDRAQTSRAGRMTFEYDLYDADAAFVGTLTVDFDATCSEATSGRLTTPDGTSLTIEWIDIGPDGTIMADLSGRAVWTHAWFEGAISPDRSHIANGTIDFWGEDLRVATGVTARGYLMDAPRQPSEWVACSIPVTRSW